MRTGKPSRPSRGVLIVEDDPVTQKALVQVLSLLGFYTTVAVGSVAESMDRLDGQHFAIIDIGLPDGLGTRVLERIRAANKPVRVAIVTGVTDSAVIEEVEKLKPELILRKPIDIAVLLEWIQRPG